MIQIIIKEWCCRCDGYFKHIMSILKEGKVEITSCTVCGSTEGYEILAPGLRYR